MVSNARRRLSLLPANSNELPNQGTSSNPRIDNKDREKTLWMDAKADHGYKPVETDKASTIYSTSMYNAMLNDNTRGGIADEERALCFTCAAIDNLFFGDFNE